MKLSIKSYYSNKFIKLKRKTFLVKILDPRMKFENCNKYIKTTSDKSEFQIFFPSANSTPTYDLMKLYKIIIISKSKNNFFVFKKVVP